MERDKLPGTLVLWPGVAEELDGAKAWYVRDGVFKDVDVVLFTHVGNNLGVSWGDGGGTGLVSVEYTFQGETAHSAGAPWRGRSALDAVELMSAGWQYPARAPAAVAALALRDHQRRRSAERRAAQRQHLVLPARDRSAAHQGDVGDRRQDGRGRGADDQHHLDVTHPRHRLSAAHEQDRWPRPCTPTSRRSACRSGARRIRRWPRRCRRSWATRASMAWPPSSARSPARSSSRTTTAAARTTSATCRGTCRRSRCATRPTFLACPATTGRAPSPAPRRSRTRASSPAPRCRR